MASNSPSVKKHTDAGSYEPAKEHDTYVSSIQTFLLLVALGVGLSYAHTVTIKTQSEHVPKIAVESILSLHMIAAIVVIALFWCSEKFSKLCIDPELKRSRQAKPSGGSTTKHSKTDEALTIVGVIIFYLLGLILDFLKIASRAICLQEYHKCGLFIFMTNMVSIFFHVVRIVFMTMVAAFCYMFHNQIMRSCGRVRYGLLLIVAAAVVIWFDSLMYESNVISNENDSIINHRLCERGQNTSVDESLKFYQCLSETTSRHNSTQWWFPILYPFNIEFLLLAIEVLLHLFFTAHSVSTMKGTHPTTKEVHTRETSRGRTLHAGGQNQHERSLDDPHIRHRRTGQTGRGVSQENRQMLLDDANDDVGHDMEAHGSRSSGIPARPKKWPTCFIVSVLINMILILFAVLTYPLSEDTNTFICIYEVVKTLYWIPGILLCLRAFRASQNFQSAFKDFDGLEMMISVSVLGSMMLAVFTIAAAFGCIIGTEALSRTARDFPGYMPVLVAFQQILKVTQIYIQTNFMAHASNVEPLLKEGQAINSDNIEEDESQTSQGSGVANLEGVLKAYGVFQNALVYLLVSNLALWGIDSFVEMKNAALVPIQDFYYGECNWHMATHILMPLTLFYRFNSFIIFTKIYRSLKKQTGI